MEKFGFVSNAAVISGLSTVRPNTDWWCRRSIDDLVAPKMANLPHELSVFLPVYPFPVGILFPVRRSYLDLPALVTGLPWWRPVLHQDGSQRASDRFPGAPGRNPTRRTDRCDLRYGWDQIPYSLPAINICSFIRISF